MFIKFFYLITWKLSLWYLWWNMRFYTFKACQFPKWRRRITQYRWCSSKRGRTGRRRWSSRKYKEAKRMKKRKKRSSSIFIVMCISKCLLLSQDDYLFKLLRRFDTFSLYAALRLHVAIPGRHAIVYMQRVFTTTRWPQMLHIRMSTVFTKTCLTWNTKQIVKYIVRAVKIKKN